METEQLITKLARKVIAHSRRSKITLLIDENVKSPPPNDGSFLTLSD